jgi:hypothetical protein
LRCVDWKFIPEEFEDGGDHPIDCVCQSSLNNYNAAQLIYHQFYPDQRFLVKALTLEKPKTLENATEIFLQRNPTWGYGKLLEAGYLPNEIWNCLKETRRYHLLNALHLPYEKIVEETIEGKFEALVIHNWSLELEKKLRSLAKDNIQSYYKGYLHSNNTNAIKNLIRLGASVSDDDFMRIQHPEIAKILLYLGARPNISVVEKVFRTNGKLYKLYATYVTIEPKIEEEIDYDLFDEIWTGI